VGGAILSERGLVRLSWNMYVGVRRVPTLFRDEEPLRVVRIVIPASEELA
jgi:hypothetical protein